MPDQDLPVVFAYITTGNLEEGERIGRALVEEGLAACTNLLPGMRSIYRWKGVYRLLAELARAEHGDGPQAREWQAKLAGAAPDPAWVCGSCGTQAHGWAAVCPHCGGFDTQAWTTPSPTLRLAAQADDGPAALFSPTSRPTRLPAPSDKAAPLVGQASQ